MMTLRTRLTISRAKIQLRLLNIENCVYSERLIFIRFLRKNINYMRTFHEIL
ncbi:hypothetical protein X975_24563, partial [Stegodyphus mimosarum]